MKLLELAGSLVHVVTAGKPDNPPVIISSGLGGAWFDWEPVVELLRDDYRVICFDRPGTGLSPGTGTTPSLRAAVRELAALARGTGRPVTVIAHSMAAFQAEALARIHPELVRGLVLVDPSYEPDARVRLRLSAVLSPLYRLTGTVLETTRLARLIGPWARRRILAQVSTRGEIATPQTVRRVYGRGVVLAGVLTENQAYSEMAADLAGLRRRRPFPDIPLVVLTALGDLGGPEQERAWAAAHAELAAMSPRGHQVELPGHLHMLQLDRPDEIAGAVAEVMSGT
ncbi:alpha/beta fold hydrolase [Actinomadura scrupuli]|uniref:alpha/beta fold hydrolase n=1 Tax=Actinomadura scrupuli TaxID=559629 RepID=UPI003D96075A